MKLFDSHAHYNDERFADYPGGMEGALRDSFDSGVCGIICVGTCPVTTDECIAIAETDGRIYATAGLHPGDLRFYDEKDDISMLEAIKAGLSHKKVCAIGEIGLDYHYGGEDRDRQRRIFDAQLSLAKETGYPVIVHDREAHGDTLDIIKAHPDVVGVMHSFSGSAEFATELLRLGWYISFSGPVTYKNAHNLRRAAAVCPSDRVLVETDAPYLPPVPHRGEINISAYMEHTALAVADAMGVDIDKFCDSTVENTKALFGLSQS